MLLTKSDFKVARTCPTKLYYKKLHYPSLLDDNPYLEFLADGGYMVEVMAHILYPDGRELGHWDDPALAFEVTRQAVAAGNGTFFEATVIYEDFLARLDILRRDGNTLELIEVKSKSIDSVEESPNPFRGTRGGIVSEWRPYLEDVTYQTMVLRRAFPEFKVIPYLCVVDKARNATANVTNDQFRLTAPEGSSWRPKVEYLGEPGTLFNDHLLALIDVSTEVSELESEVEAAAEGFASTVRSDSIKRIEPAIGQKCKSCEYRLPADHAGPVGFCECWGSLAQSDPHILDLYRVDLLGDKNSDVVLDLARKGKSNLCDIPPSYLDGTTAVRQAIQIDCAATNEEYIAAELPGILASHQYPLHFIDFEASRIAIPYHVGMRPYEIAAFQWSCHTLREPGCAPDHTYWLNADDAFPNFEFARSLREQIGNDGTVYIWSHYEKDILREVAGQTAKYGISDPSLTAWLHEARSSPRVVDLLELAKDHYCHPQMKGSLSIKYVLPAVWSANASIREHPLFARYVSHGVDGKLLNPYDTLPPLP